MIVSNIKILADPDNKNEILEILFSVKGPTEVKRGCLSCGIYQDIQNERIIAYEEVWESKESLYNHIRSAFYRSILAAVDMSSEPPEIKFNTVSNITGIELIKEALGHIDIE